MKTRISRFLWFVFGVVLNSFGIAFITKAALGTSPISSLPYVLSFAFPLSPVPGSVLFHPEYGLYPGPDSAPSQSV